VGREHVGEEQRCSVVRQRWSCGLWQQVRGSSRRPRAIPLRTRMEVIPRCGFAKMGRGAVTPPEGPAPQTSCRSPQTVHPPSSITQPALSPVPLKLGETAVPRGTWTSVCACTHVCVCVHTCTHLHGILPPEAPGSPRRATSQGGHDGTKGAASSPPLSACYLSPIPSLFQFVLQRYAQR